MALVPFQRSNSSVPLSSSSSSFRTCPPQWRFDVFLSFRGEDTRDNFISHLYKELDRKGINTFIDDEKLKIGKEISPELLNAIEESRFSVVVISIRYASSRWCLDELVKILECKNARGQEVYPVFFHVDPSEVRNQTGTFGKGFDELVPKHEIAKVESWKEALNQVGKLAGLAYPNPKMGSEAKLIEEIVRKIDVCTSVDEGLVGMDSCIEKVIELLEKNDSHVFGIWGMGGMGKTTIANVVYDRISCKFDGCCFIENVRDVSKKGIKSLQEQLISNLLKEKDYKVSDVTRGRSMIKGILSQKKVLIVLDDVNESKELENLLGESDWLSSGSKIIITSRDWHVLKTCGAKDPYKVCELEKDEAVKLFKMKAFRKGKQPREGHENLLDRAVEYCKGVPLALKVLGSYLHDREEIHWEYALNKLERNPLREVEEVLKISYESLESEQKEIFLDIACFIKWKYTNHVTKILESFGFQQPFFEILPLHEKCLITISHDQIVMHDLIREMGRNIVLQESPKEVGQCSRLWLDEDIKHVLMNCTGTEKVEGIVMEDRYLRSQDPKEFEFLKELKLSSKAFKKQRNLRILKIHSFHLSKDFKYLPSNLRYLDWHGYPLRCMPSKFRPINLVELHMNYSNIEQLWMGTEVLPHLRSMSLAFSKLTTSPNFEMFPNLELLDLEGCRSLVNLHPSIGSLRRLTYLQLYGCENIESIPDNIGQLKALQSSTLHRKLRLQELPEEVGDMECLVTFHAMSTGIRQLPSSICRLYSLEKLTLLGNNFESLPSSINQLSRLQDLCLSQCNRLQELPELPSKIHYVSANNCTSLRTIASPSIYKDIRKFSFFNCSKLAENKESNILSDKFLSNQFQGSQNREEDHFLIVFPGSNIPKWFNHQRNGSSMCLELPPHWFNNKLLGIAVAFVGIMNMPPELTLDCFAYQINHKTIHIHSLKLGLGDLFSYRFPLGIKFKCTGVLYIPRKVLSSDSDILNGGDITFEWEKCHYEPFEVEKWGVRLVYKDEAPTRYNNSIISSQHDNNLKLVVSQGVEEEDANNAPSLKTRRPPSERGNFQKEDCRNIKSPRPRLEREFNTRVTPPPNKGGWKKTKSSQKRKILSPKRKNMKLMWMSTWHKRVIWIQSNQSGGWKKLKSSQKRKILSPKRKNMKLMWMSTWHKRVIWIRSNQSRRRMGV